MAYLYRGFDRQQQAPPPVGLGGSGGLAPGIGSAGVGYVDPGQGAPGAVRSFFEQNKAQGADLLNGLADGLNKRIASEGQRFTAAAPSGLIHSSAEQQALEDAEKKRAADQLASIQPLGGDVRLLDQGQEGMQTLLDRQNQGAPGGYSPGQSRLDAWLAGGAANANPGAIGGVDQNWAALQRQAGQMVNPYAQGIAAPPRSGGPYSPPREHNTGTEPIVPTVQPGQPGGYGQPGYNPRNGAPGKPRRSSPR